MGKNVGVIETSAYCMRKLYSKKQRYSILITGLLSSLIMVLPVRQVGNPAPVTKPVTSRTAVDR